MAISNLISGLKNLWLGTYESFNDVMIPSIIGSSGAPFDINNADKISTVFTCIKILSETLSRMPLNIYTSEDGGRTVSKTDYLYPILHYQPNGWTNQQTFFTTLEYWRNLKGNSFARIYRDNTGRVTSLVLIPPSKVISYAVTNGELYYTIIDEKDKDKTEVVNASDILHFKGITRDGIWGITNLEALRLNLSSTFSGMNTIDAFYKNSAITPKALKSTVSGANQKAMIEALEEFNRKYAGSAKSGSMATLPPNVDVVDLGMNLADVMFIDLIKFNTTQISALYGVPSWMCGILEQTKFASVETTQREFMATTLGPILRGYRQEMESKLLTINERLNGKSIEFNTEAYYELDSKSRIENLKTLEGMGVVTPNDVCRIEGFPTYAAGDMHLLPGNYLTVDQIVSKSAPVK